MAEQIEHLRRLVADVAVAMSTNVVDDLAAALGAVQQLLNTVEEVRRRVVAEAAASGHWAAEGFRSLRPWVALHTGLPPAAAAQLAREAQTLAQLPATASAALSGILNEAHTSQITRCAVAAPGRFDADCDAAFAGLAASGDLAGFAQAVRSWMAAVDAEHGPDGSLPETRAYFSLSETFDGWWRGDLLLAPEDGALLNQAIERRTGRYLRARREGDPSVEALPIAAVRAQALVDIADTALRNDGAKRCAPDRYSIALTFQANEDGTLHADPCHPPGAACDSSVFRLVVGAHGEVLDLGRSVRTTPPHLASAVSRRDGHCTFPGCDAPPGHCDCHHCEEWEQGGETDIHNLTLLCRWHHSFIHRYRWRVHLDEHQHPIFTKPDGTTATLASCAPSRSLRVR